MYGLGEIKRFWIQDGRDDYSVPRAFLGECPA